MRTAGDGVEPVLCSSTLGDGVAGGGFVAFSSDLVGPHTEGGSLSSTGGMGFTGCDGVEVAGRSVSAGAGGGGGLSEVCVCTVDGGGVGGSFFAISRGCDASDGRLGTEALRSTSVRGNESGGTPRMPCGGSDASSELTR